MTSARVITGDCRRELGKLAAGSVDCVITDPPYPGVPKAYGVWTEEEWFDLMNAVVPEVRRVLRPTGSAVFILKPNSEKAGRMRLWVPEFIVQWGRKWNVVQDFYGWNYAQLPFGAATTCGLARASVHHCVWLGPPDCYRDQDAVLIPESETSKYRRAKMKPEWKTGHTSPSASKRNSDRPRLDQRRGYAAAARRGGVTPFNLIATTNTRNPEPGNDHPARTPEDLARFWVRYLTPPNGLVLDPFAGSGTVLRVALEEGKRALGVEVVPEYAAGIRERLKAKMRA